MSNLSSSEHVVNDEEELDDDAGGEEFVEDNSLASFESFCQRFEEVRSSKLEPPPAKKMKLDYDNSLCVSPSEIPWSSEEKIQVEKKKNNVTKRNHQNQEDEKEDDDRLYENEEEELHSKSEPKTVENVEDEENLEVIDTSDYHLRSKDFLGVPFKALAVQIDLIKFKTEEDSNESTNSGSSTSKEKTPDSRARAQFKERLIRNWHEMIRNAEQQKTVPTENEMNYKECVCDAEESVTEETTETDTLRSISVIRSAEYFDVTSEFTSFRCSHLIDVQGQEVDNDASEFAVCQISSFDEPDETNSISEKDNDDRINVNDNYKKGIDGTSKLQILISLDSKQSSHSPSVNKSDQCLEEKVEYYFENNEFHNKSKISSSSGPSGNCDESFNTNSEENPNNSCEEKSDEIYLIKPEHNVEENYNSEELFELNDLFLENADEMYYEDSLENNKLDGKSNSLHECEHTFSEATQDPTPRTIEIPPKRRCTRKDIPTELSESFCLTTNWTFLPGTVLDDLFPTRKENPIFPPGHNLEQLEEPDDQSTTVSSLKIELFRPITHKSASDTCLPRVSISIGTNTKPQSASPSISPKGKDQDIYSERSSISKCCSISSLSNITTVSTQLSSLPTLSSSLHDRTPSPKSSIESSPINSSRVSFRKSILCNPSAVLERIDENVSSQNSTLGQACDLCQDSEKTSLILSLSDSSLQIPELLEMDLPLRPQTSYTVATVLTSMKNAFRKVLPSGQVAPDSCLTGKNLKTNLDSKLPENDSKENLLTYFPSEEVVKTINYSDYFLQNKEGQNEFLEDVVDSMGKMLKPLRNSLSQKGSQILASECKEKSNKSMMSKSNKQKIAEKFEIPGIIDSDGTCPNDDRFLTPSKKDVRKSEQENSIFIDLNQPISDQDARSSEDSFRKNQTIPKKKFTFEQILKTSSENSPRRKWFRADKGNQKLLKNKQPLNIKKLDHKVKSCSVLNKSSLQASPRKKQILSMDFYDVETQIQELNTNMKEKIIVDKSEQNDIEAGGEGHCECHSKSIRIQHSDIQIISEADDDSVDVKCCSLKFWNRLFFNSRKGPYF